MPVPSTVPRHVAVIMDGNRRFSKRLMLEPWRGHELGAAKLENLANWCKELGIRELTVYAFSVQNFGRSKEEYDFLVRIFTTEIRKLRERIAAGEFKDLRVTFIGRINLFPAELQEQMHAIVKETEHCTGYRFNFAMAYGGREELIDAVKKMGNEIKQGKLKPEDVDEKVIGEHLYMNSEPDLVIRTGGDHRTSNFLIWQSWYSEWFFLDKLWPEFEKEDLVAVIEEFNKRERRFGK